MAAPKSSNPFDLFGTLTKVSNKQYWAYGEMDEKQQKACPSVVLMKWMKSSTNPKTVIRLNEGANRHIFHLSRHPELQFKLLCGAQPKAKSERFQWIASAKLGGLPMSVEVIKDYFRVSTRVAVMYLKNLSNQDILSIAADLGYQSTDVTKLTNELKTRI